MENEKKNSKIYIICIHIDNMIILRYIYILYNDIFLQIIFTRIHNL